jgi:hypothetical protein
MSQNELRKGFGAAFNGDWEVESIYMVVNVSVYAMCLCLAFNKSRERFCAGFNGGCGCEAHLCLCVFSVDYRFYVLPALC